MKHMNTKNFLMAATFVVLASACGKNMNMRVAGQSTQSAPAGADYFKVAPAVSAELEGLSEFDLKELKDTMTSESLYRRAILHVEPKDAVKRVITLDLILDHAKIADLSKAGICVDQECRPLAAFITDPTSTTIQFDLRKVFGLDKKTDAEVMDWIYANTSVFGDPGYRKLRLSFQGIESFECADLNYQTEVSTDKLPKDFASALSCYENGDEDAKPAVVEASPSPSPAESPAQN